MSAVYPAAVDAFLNGDIDIIADGMVAVLTDGYVYDAGHVLIGDVIGEFGTPEAVSVDHVTNGEVFVDPVVFPSVPTGNTVGGIVFYIAGSGVLVCFIDRRADTIPLKIDTNDGDIRFTWPRLFKL